MAREAARLAAGSITVFIETDKFKTLTLGDRLHERWTSLSAELEFRAGGNQMGIKEGKRQPDLDCDPYCILMSFKFAHVDSEYHMSTNSLMASLS